MRPTIANKIYYRRAHLAGGHLIVPDTAVVLGQAQKRFANGILCVIRPEHFGQPRQGLVVLDVELPQRGLCRGVHAYTALR